MATRATRSASRKARLTEAVATGPLGALSHDELGVIIDGLVVGETLGSGPDVATWVNDGLGLLHAWVSETLLLSYPRKYRRMRRGTSKQSLMASPAPRVMPIEISLRGSRAHPAIRSDSSE